VGMSERIIAFTGHRPDKLPNKETGYTIPNPTYIHVCRETERLLKELNPTKCISGMAIGYDSYAAFVCIKLGIPFVAAIPFLGQEKRWVQKSKDQYKWLLSKAAEQVIVCPEFSIAAFQRRNEWMVDNATDVIVCWDGSKGGTGNCVAYAEKVGKPIHRIVPIVKEDE
jgi:uncharacterized phage-like protein YoqJ